MWVYPSHLNHFKENSMKRLTASEWLSKATRFDLGICPYHNRPVIIEYRPQLDGSVLWVVKMNEWVLGKDGSFHWEPLPSSRTDEFIDLTRFASPYEAHTFWVKEVTKAQRLTVE